MVVAACKDSFSLYVSIGTTLHILHYPYVKRVSTLHMTLHMTLHVFEFSQSCCSVEILVSSEPDIGKAITGHWYVCAQQASP